MHKSISLSRIVLSVIFLITVAQALAQTMPKFEWAKQTARGTGDEYSWEVTADAAGNVFSIGAHTAITDFDPGAGTVELDATVVGNAFISKLAADGTFLWVKTLEATGAYGIVTDAAGNVYVTGSFLGTIDFDPGPGVFNLSNTNRDLFVLKLDGNGNFLWAVNFDPENGNSIAYDPTGFVYVGASRSSSSQCSVIKINAADGTHIWTRSLGSGTGASSIAVGASGNVVATGFLTGTSDFDPGPGTFNLTSPVVDLFIWKLNGNGDFVWAKQIATAVSGAIDVMRSFSSIDAAENVYLTHNFIGPQDFDPGPGTFTINGSGMFVCKLNANGDFAWAKLVSSGTVPNFISTDASGNSYITGEFAGTVDFNPGPGTFNLTHAGNGDTYILKLNSAGDFVWATRTGSPSGDEGTAIHADAVGNVYLTSYFYQFADFDPTCTNLNLTARNNGDTYIQKLSNVIPPTITSFTPTTGSSGTEVTITGLGFSPTPANNTVRFFNGVTATVTASTATSITATAPIGIATGKLAVTVGCYFGQSAADFVLPSCIEKLFDFTGAANGTEPWGSLISDGTFLYGMTETGGANDMGVVFKIRKDGTGYTKLLDFAGSTNGSYPQGSLFSDGVFLYGMTVLGGANNMGVVFKIRNDGTGFVKLLDFAGATNGRLPHGSLVSDGSFLYGMTSAGGTNDLGTIFKIMTDGTGYVKLLDFVAVANGSAPLGSLMYDGAFLYGMTSDGGSSSFGTVFKIRPDGTGFVRLLSLNNTTGRDAFGDLVSDGTFLYGMTSRGGTIGDGTIFKVRTDGTGFSKLLDFNVNTNGDSPFGSLTLNGTSLYGLTYSGIGSAFGTLFRINTDGSAHTVLCNMPSYTDGALPPGSLVLDGGVLYGMTQLGGTSDMGVIFKYAIGGGTPTITSFAPASGPVGTTLTITGTNFDTTPANNTVYFGAVKATVTASTTTQLTVTVPAGATYQPMSVLVNGLTAFSQKPFAVTFADGGIIDACAFAPNVDITPGVSPYTVAVGDLDNDGKPDIAIANADDNTISVFKNISTTGTITTASFAPKVDFTTGDSPRGIFIKDLDGDGKPEMGVANNNASTLSILRNTTTPGTINTSSFATKVDFATGSRPHDIAIHDFDADGKPDLAVTNRFSTTVSVLKNTSFTGSITTSSFAPKVDFATASGPQGIVSRDIDGDGKADLVIADEGASSISVLRNTASTGILDLSSFAAKVDFVVGPNPTTVAIADLDGDGKNDVAVSNADDGTVSVLRNTSTSGTINASSFSAAEDFFSNGGYAIEIDDIDGDGKPDLVTNSSPAKISVLKNQSSVGTITSSSFAARVEFAIGDNIEGGLAIGDLDGNGKPDLVASGSSIASILRNTVSGLPSFSATGFTPASGPPGEIVTITGTNFSSTPLNNTVKFNGTVAVVTASTSTSISAIVPSGATTGSISLEIGCNQAFTVLPFTVTAIGPPTITSFTPGSGVIGTTVTITGTNFSATPSSNIVFFGATRATVTASTSTQLTVTVPTGATYAPITVLNSATSLLAYSMSIFTPTFSPGKGSIEVTDFEPKVDFIPGSNPISVALADFDGDGKADMATANTVSNTVSIFRNTSTGPGNISYAPKADLSNTTDPVCVSIGDFDGDGKPDIAVANYLAFAVSIYRNTSTAPGNITFATRIDFSNPGLSTRAVAVGDLDGDGKTDLALANDNANSVSVFRNTSTGTGNINFATKVDYPTGQSPRYVAIGDFDGDEKKDLALANYNTNSVSVLRNTSPMPGSIQFDAKVDFTTGTSANFVSTGDLDGDGKLDLATLNVNGPSVSVLLNTSTGLADINFAPKVDYPTNSAPRSVVIGDLDGDAKPDLAATNHSIGFVSVLRNISTGAGNADFDAIIDLTTQQGSAGIAIGDLDNDGRSDLAVTNATSNSISVIRNNPVFLSATPAIASFTPTTGIVGTTVIITGTDFSPTPTDNIVEFNGVTAVVTASTTTSITTTVPAAATTGPITVTVGGNSGTSAIDFTVTLPDITITTQPSSSSVCANVNATFTTAATGTTNITYQWQFSSTSTGTFNDIANGSNYSNVTTATLSVNTSGNFGVGFYRCKINGDLVTPEFTNDASLTIQPIPSAPVTTSASRCGDGTLTLNASGGVDGQYKWYSAATGGTAIAGAVNSAYTTPSLSATTQFYVSNTSGSCESDRTQVTATITPLPSAPTGTGGSACQGSTITLTATGGSNGQYKWYTDATTTTQLPGEVNNSYTTPVLAQTISYFVSVVNSGCESSRSSVTATIVTSGCAPEIEVAALSTVVQGTIVIDLKPLITTTGTLDVSSIKVTSGPESGAITSIENGILTITYTGVNFGGSESITVEACNTNGLCGRQDFTIEVNGDIRVYNAVSPNDDGKNEIFILEFIDALPSTKSNKVSIYNRWGDEVFSVSDYDNKTRVFSGRNKEGNKVSPGTYYYKIYFPEQDKTVTGYLSVKY